VKKQSADGTLTTAWKEDVLWRSSPDAFAKLRGGNKVEVVVELQLEANQCKLKEEVLYDARTKMLYYTTDHVLRDQSGVLYHRKYEVTAITPWEAEDLITKLSANPDEAKERLQKLLGDTKQSNERPEKSEKTEKRATNKQKSFLLDLLKKRGLNEGFIKEKLGKGLDELTASEASKLITEVQKK
jgi:hypothetical protein